MNSNIEINGRIIGPTSYPYIIAELSANHNGSIDQAFSIMEAAKKAGADAIKIQTYTADTMTIDHDGEDFQLTEGPWAGKGLYELYEWAHTPWEWHEALFEKGKQLGITVFSTPFDKTSVDFLESFNPPAYKIASFELVDTPLIEYAASKGKPLIMSTGMASRDEIMEAVLAAHRGGCKELCLLHCTSGYPTPPAEADIRTIQSLKERFGSVTGLSDHTLGTAVSVAAVALGANVIEKHFILSRDDGGPDAHFSLEPDELRQLVQDSRIAWEALGKVRDTQRKSENTQKPVRRSLYVVKDIKAGEVFTETNVRSIRPGYGLAPRYLPILLGCKATMDIPRGTALCLEHFSI